MMPRSTRYGIFSMNPAYVPRRAGAIPELGSAVKPGHVRLVDDGLAPRAAERTVALPVVARRYRRPRSSSRRRRRSDRPPRPGDSPRGGDAAAVRVEQDLGRVEAQPLVGRPWPVGARTRRAGRRGSPGHGRASSRRSDRSCGSRWTTRAGAWSSTPSKSRRSNTARALGVDIEVDSAGHERRAQVIVAARLHAGPAREHSVRLPIGGRGRRHHQGYSPTLACIIRPSTVCVAADPYEPRRGRGSGARCQASARPRDRRCVDDTTATAPLDHLFGRQLDQSHSGCLLWHAGGRPIAHWRITTPLSDHSKGKAKPASASGCWRTTPRPATKFGPGSGLRSREDQLAFATCHVPPNATMPSPFVWPGAVSLMNS